jgi:hypothetical protein
MKWRCATTSILLMAAGCTADGPTEPTATPKDPDVLANFGWEIWPTDQPRTFFTALNGRLEWDGAASFPSSGVVHTPGEHTVSSVATDGRRADKKVTVKSYPDVRGRISTLSSQGSYAVSVGFGMNFPTSTMATDTFRAPASAIAECKEPTGFNAASDSLSIKVSPMGSMSQLNKGAFYKVSCPKRSEGYVVSEQKFALMPRQYFINTGPLIGQTASLSMTAAMSRSASDGSSFLIGYTNEVNMRPLPAFLAIDPVASTITPSSSELAEFQKRLGLANGNGQEYFRHGTIDESASRGAPIVISDTVNCHFCVVVSVDTTGKLLKTRITMKYSWMLTHPMLLHELMHVLGFYHTCSFPSVMNGYGCAQVHELTAHDVAWMLYHYVDLRNLQETKGVSASLTYAAAHRWEMLFTPTGNEVQTLTRTIGPFPENDFRVDTVRVVKR